MPDMKQLIFLSAFLLFTAFSCEKEEAPCVAAEVAACQDVVPTEEMCDAYFVRWFYKPDTKSCERAEYSGCNEKGFASQAECEACKCNNTGSNT